MSFGDWVLIKVETLVPFSLDSCVEEGKPQTQLVFLLISGFILGLDLRGRDGDYVLSVG